MGAPRRYPGIAAVGAFDQGAVTSFAASAPQLAGSDTMWRILVYSLHGPVVSLERILATDANVNSGWHFWVQGTLAEVRVNDGSAAQIAAIDTAGYRRGVLLWGIGWGSGNLVAEILGVGAASDNGAAGFAAGAHNLTIGDRGGGGAGVRASGAVPAILGSDSEALDAAGLHSALVQVAANLAEERDLRTGLTPTAERYWDGADWPGYGPWLDRVASAQLDPTGQPQRFEAPGRAVGV